MKNLSGQAKTGIWIGVLLLAVVLALLDANPSWRFWNNWNFRSSEATTLLNKGSYANVLNFNFQTMRDGEPLNLETRRRASNVIADLMWSYSQYFDPQFTEFILVYTKEEALTHSDNVITASPSTQTLRDINALNWAVRDEIDSIDSSLEFPITLTDVVENWEEVYGLDFLRILYSILDDGNRKYGNSPEFIAEMEQLLWEASLGGVPSTKISVDDVLFAEDFDFEFRMIADGRVITDPVEILLRTQALYPEFFNPFYADFVFVMTEEEALSHPDSVITVWPSRETQEMMNALNWVIQHEGCSDGRGIGRYQDVDVSEFQFEFPITTTDMVKNREELNELWRSLPRPVHESIRNMISSPRVEGNSPEFLAKLESLKEQRDAEVSE